MSRTIYALLYVKVKMWDPTETMKDQHALIVTPMFCHAHGCHVINNKMLITGL